MQFNIWYRRLFIWKTVLRKYENSKLTLSFILSVVFEGCLPADLGCPHGYIIRIHSAAVGFIESDSRQCLLTEATCSSSIDRSVIQKCDKKPRCLLTPNTLLTRTRCPSQRRRKVVKIAYSCIATGRLRRCKIVFKSTEHYTGWSKKTGPLYICPNI